MFVTISNVISILRYTWNVRGYKKVTSSSCFPIQMGSTESDMFRIDVDDPTSLVEFHAAFLSSPVFQFELSILSLITDIDPKVKTQNTILQVATGEYQTYGPWSAWAVDGVKSQRISKTSPCTLNKPASSCQIMRCHINGKPFCDTWWAVEKTVDSSTPELVFGTAFKTKPGETKAKHWSLILFDPFHRLYSRLLLGSAKWKLLQMQQVIKQHQK